MIKKKWYFGSLAFLFLVMSICQFSMAEEDPRQSSNHNFCGALYGISAVLEGYWAFQEIRKKNP